MCFPNMGMRTMTVVELIEKLKGMPQDFLVYMYVYGEEKEVEEVVPADAFGVIDGCVELM